MKLPRWDILTNFRWQIVSDPSLSGFRANRSFIKISSEFFSQDWVECSFLHQLKDKVCPCNMGFQWANNLPLTSIHQKWQHIQCILPFRKVSDSFSNSISVGWSTCLATTMASNLSIFLVILSLSNQNLNSFD